MWHWASCSFNFSAFIMGWFLSGLVFYNGVVSLRFGLNFLEGGYILPHVTTWSVERTEAFEQVCWWLWSLSLRFLLCKAGESNTTLQCGCDIRVKWVSVHIACHAVSDIQSALNKCKLFIIINPNIFITRDNESHVLAGYKGQKDHVTFL